jgi:hypothetical protein
MIQLGGKFNILIEFGVPMKLVMLIKMCLNEMYSKVHIGKHLSDSIPIQNGLKQGDDLSPLLFNSAYIGYWWESQKDRNHQEE